jgi:hypothetical protein
MPNIMKKIFAIIAMVTMVGVYAFSVDTEKPKTADNKSACAAVENVVKTSAAECGGGAEVVKTANVEKSGCGDANVVKTANIVEKAADCSEAGGAEAVAVKAEGACCSAKTETDSRVAENK